MRRFFDEKGLKGIGYELQRLESEGFKKKIFFEVGITWMFFFLRWEMLEHFYSQRG